MFIYIQGKGYQMPHGSMTAEQLLEKIYEDNFSHVDFMDNMGGDCDCAIHTTLNTIARYLGIEVDA
jgi:uncharacterized Fe-S center protein